MNSRDDGEELTSYALGEAHAERRWVLDAELAKDARARAEVQAIRGVAAVLEKELARPTGLSLSAEQRAAIVRAASVRVVASAPKVERKPAEQEREEAVRADRTVRRRVFAGAVGGALLGAACVALFVVRSGRHVVEEELAEVEFAAAPEEPAPMPLHARARRRSYSLEKLPGPVDAFTELADDPRAAPSDESYAQIDENPFVPVAHDPRSTFSIDVDTASYALVRRFLREGRLPPKDAVRIEELVNYFDYAYPEPGAEHPFSVTAEVAAAPWAPDHQLVRIGLKARQVAPSQRTASNLVFLIDVSGSMVDQNKLPLLKEGLRMLVRKLDARDRVSIVVYAGASGLVLPATRGDRKEAILDAIERLDAGGSTNGGEGIQLAYATAAEQFVKGGVNRVLLATDGDFNVGVTDHAELIDLIQKQAKTGVFLSVLGFGTGNYKDAMLEQLADKGNGNYAYVDDVDEARKVLSDQAEGTLITVAKDVKLQVEWNPEEVESFRLLGYENRVLGHRDFNDDTKDAGELGAGHTVTAFYEVVPADGASGRSLDPLKYQKPEPAPARVHGGELLTVKLRYKLPEQSESRMFELAVKGSERSAEEASADFRFGAAVAAFGMLLRESPNRGDASYAKVLELARSGARFGRDEKARAELLELIRTARALEPQER